MAEFQRDIPEAIDGLITVPTGDGARTFVDVDDIAAVAAATLAQPDAHAGAHYAPTGPEAITVSGAADVIAEVIGQPSSHSDIDRDTGCGSVAAGVPASTGEILRMLTESHRLRSRAPGPTAMSRTSPARHRSASRLRRRTGRPGSSKEDKVTTIDNLDDFKGTGPVLS